MELYSTHSDPRNSDFIDNRGFTVYRVTTNSSFTSSGTSTISRFVTSQNAPPQEVVIAQIEWHSFKSTLFRFRGVTVKEGQYIPGSGFVTRKRNFTAGSGRAYSWSGNVLNLNNAHEVARWHNKSHGYFSGAAHQAYIQVAGDAIPDLDEVIMTLVYVQGKARDDGDTATFTAIGAAAGAS